MEMLKTRQKLCKIEQLFNVGQEGKTSDVKHRIRLQQNTMRRGLKNRILLWFGLLERMEESSQPSKCLKFEVCGILATT